MIPSQRSLAVRHFPSAIGRTTVPAATAVVPLRTLPLFPANKGLAPNINSTGSRRYDRWNYRHFATESRHGVYATPMLDEEHS